MKFCVIRYFIALKLKKFENWMESFEIHYINEMKICSSRAQSIKQTIVFYRQKKNKLHLSKFGRHCIGSVVVSNRPHHEYHVYHLRGKKNQEKNKINKKWSQLNEKKPKLSRHEIKYVNLANYCIVCCTVTEKKLYPSSTYRLIALKL